MNNNHWPNILAILAFFWPYALLVVAYVVGVLSNGQPPLVWMGALGMVVAIWTLSFRELRHM